MSYDDYKAGNIAEFPFMEAEEVSRCDSDFGGELL